MVAHSSGPWPTTPHPHAAPNPLPRLRPGANVFRYFDSTERVASHAEATAWQIVSLQAAIAGDDEEARCWGGVLEHNLFLLRQTLAEANDELRRRRKLAAHPGAPPWPNDRTDARAELDRLKELLPLSQFLTACYRDRQIVRRGRQWAVRCVLPGHSDRDPSMLIDPTDRFFYCHVCNIGGDVLTLTQEALGLGFPEAVALLKREAHYAETGRWGGDAVDG